MRVMPQFEVKFYWINLFHQLRFIHWFCKKKSNVHCIASSNLHEGFAVSSNSGAHYSLTIVNDFSYCFWMFSMKHWPHSSSSKIIFSSSKKISTTLVQECSKLIVHLPLILKNCISYKNVNTNNVKSLLPIQILRVFRCLCCGRNLSS